MNLTALLAGPIEALRHGTAPAFRPPTRQNAELRQRLHELAAADEDVSTAKALLDGVLRTRYALLERIASNHGTGPLLYNGRVVSIIHRENQWFIRAWRGTGTSH